MKMVMAVTVGCAMCVLVGCSSRPYTVESIIEAQREYNAKAAPTGPLSTPSTAAPVAATDSKKPVEQTYRTLNSLHWISIVLELGNRVKLEDNSIWQVYPADIPKVRNWSIANTINMAKGVNPDFPFRMTNSDKNEFADVRLLAQ